MTRYRLSPHIVVSGRLPPPIDGMSRVTALVLDQLRARAPVQVADLSPGWNGGGLRYHATKVRRVLEAAWTLAAGASKPDKRFYMPADAGWGSLYSAFLMGTARLLGYRRVLHHHSFAPIVRPNWRMDLLTRVAGADCTHVLLSPMMQARFQQAYPAAQTAMVMSNAIFTPPEPRRSVRREGPLRLGHLSNLCPDKGLDTLFCLMSVLQEEGIEAELHLAGPGLGRMDNALVAAGLAAYDGAVRYLGPLEGEEKDAFYRSIDAFIFPTRYRNEAQPLVLFEAMAAGVPVLAYDRGCIGGDLPRTGVIPQDQDFVRTALPILRQWARDRDSLALASDQALARARVAHEASEAGFEAVLARIAGPMVESIARAPAKRRALG